MLLCICLINNNIHIPYAIPMIGIYTIILRFRRIRIYIRMQVNSISCCYVHLHASYIDVHCSQYM